MSGSLDGLFLNRVCTKTGKIGHEIKAGILNCSCSLTFQAPCQVELENWVNSIHSACAAAFARHRGKTGTLHLLQEEIYRIEKGIEGVRIFFWDGVTD